MVNIPIDSIPGEPGGGVHMTGAIGPTGQIGVTGFLLPTSARIQSPMKRRRRVGKKKKR